jgi:hypothetical protein
MSGNVFSDHLPMAGKGHVTFMMTMSPIVSLTFTARNFQLRWLFNIKKMPN